ncbi:MAG: SH3 domain-containing protein [Anaerolineae bacterium]|nr:SH3 domain-containing protein [Anaerolineae bacterium]
MIDLLEYLRGDGRLYELVNNLGSNEISQTQTEAGNVFYTVKNSQWEELWFDDVFIYRGTDTSPGGINIYILSEDNHYGSAWVPRWFEVGQLFKRTAVVMWRKKISGAAVPETPTGTAVTYIRLERIYSQLTFASGIQLQDVIELHAYVDDGGRPASSPWEKYFYARGYGLVGFEDMYGGFKSWITQKFSSSTMPNRVREVVPWLIPLQKRYYLPSAPTTSAVGQSVLSKMPSDYVNIRNYPHGYAKDIGDLHTGDQVTLFTPESGVWVKVQFGALQGWVSRQSGKVEFSSTNAPPPSLPEVTPVGQYEVTQIPSSWINVRDYPNESGQDIGDLHLGDVVTLYTPEINGWVYIDAGSLEGWVWRQEGKVTFTAVATTPEEPIPPDDLPDLPTVKSIGQYVLQQIPSDWVNVRTYPDAVGADVGDLRKGDIVTLYSPEVNGWSYITKGELRGWVSLQNGRVALTPVIIDTPIPHDPVPTLPTVQPVGQYKLSKIPGTWINVRAYPDTIGADIGDLHVDDIVTLYKPEVNGWVFVETGNMHGWVSLQNGRVAFEAAAQAARTNGTIKAPALATPIIQSQTTTQEALPLDPLEAWEDEDETTPGDALEAWDEPDAEPDTEPVLSVTVAQAELAEGEEESVDASAQAAGGVVDRVKSGIGRIINRKRG